MARSENLINVEHVAHAFGTRILLSDLTLGLSRGDVIGVVGRNGDGKTTLLRILTGELEPDSGRVTHNGRVSIGYLRQAENMSADATVRDVVIQGQPDHVWASDPERRGIVADLLSDIAWEQPIRALSGGERRRVALVALMFGNHDLLVLDEPTNHLDVEAVAWLADHLNALQRQGVAMLVVSHDRWFLDAICTRVWEVHDGVVDAYDGGYAAYVLARVERQRMAAVTEQRRQNLARKELAWLRRGAPARTSKPKFRIDAANALIADVPEPRDSLELQRFATARLGKDVFDLAHVDVTLPGDDSSTRVARSENVEAAARSENAGGAARSENVGGAARSESLEGNSTNPGRVLFRDLTWSIGPGERIGLIGVNGAGKTTLLRLLTGDRRPDAGKIKRGQTLRVAHLSQAVTELNESERVLESVERLKRETKLATGRDASASSLLGDFGFTGDKLTTRIGELSGGERRRLQFLRLLLSEPNVLLLDEPTNDLDIDTLTVIEDYLDTWPGTLIVVSHDRYFLERVTDVTYALMGDGTCVLLPRGVDQYLEARRALAQAPTSAPDAPAAKAPSSAAAQRQARKDMQRVEGQLSKLDGKIAKIHEQMADAASDYGRLTELQRDLDALQAEHDEREMEWLEAAERAES